MCLSMGWICGPKLTTKDKIASLNCNNVHNTKHVNNYMKILENDIRAHPWVCLWSGEFLVMIFLLCYSDGSCHFCLYFLNLSFSNVGSGSTMSLMPWYKNKGHLGNTSSSLCMELHVESLSPPELPHIHLICLCCPWFLVIRGFKGSIHANFWMLHILLKCLNCWSTMSLKPCIPLLGSSYIGILYYRLLHNDTFRSTLAPFSLGPFPIFLHMTMGYDWALGP